VGQEKKTGKGWEEALGELVGVNLRWQTGGLPRKEDLKTKKKRRPISSWVKNGIQRGQRRGHELANSSCNELK